MTLTDIISTLEFNQMLKKQGGGYQIVMNQDYQEPAHRLYAKAELLTWVPYMVATKEGDAGILNIPRETNTIQQISSSDISTDAIIPSSSSRRQEGIRKRPARTVKPSF
jgi:hypothetical protein